MWWSWPSSTGWRSTSSGSLTWIGKGAISSRTIFRRELLTKIGDKWSELERAIPGICQPTGHKTRKG